jgi:hypothetical protein
MKHVFTSSRKHAARLRRARFDCENSTRIQLRDRHQKRIDLIRPQRTDRFCPDWFAQRIWEDDGGGQAQAW